MLHVIEDLEDERSRAQRREKIWIALILHLLLFGALLLLPRFFPPVQVRDVGESKEKHDQITALTLPPSVLKQLQRQAPAPPPRPQPTPRSLQAPPAPKAPPTPKPASKPAPRPLPQAPQPQAAPPPPQQQPALPLPKPAPAAPPETARPQAGKPNFSNTPATPGEAVQQAARQAAHGSSADEGNVPSAPGSRQAPNQGAVSILSDTLGVNFDNYIQRVIYATKRAWYPIIPEVAQPPISKQGRVLIRFKILPDGSVTDMHLEGPSGDVSLDRAAWGGIVGGAPFPQLPHQFKGPFLELRFYFMYNDAPGVR